MVVVVVITVMSVKKKRDEKKNKDNLKQQELSEVCRRCLRNCVFDAVKAIISRKLWYYIVVR